MSKSQQFNPSNFRYSKISEASDEAVPVLNPYVTKKNPKISLLYNLPVIKMVLNQ
jgi:hypothetical protein